MQRSASRVLLLAALMTAAGQAHGAPGDSLYLQAPANQGLSYFDTSVPSEPGWFSSDDFTLPSQSQITSLRWWGDYFNVYHDDVFLVDLFRDPLPGSDPIASFVTYVVRTSTTLVSDPPLLLPVYQYDLVLPAPIFLAAGRYYLGVKQIVPTQADPQQWFWLTSGPGQFYFFSSGEQGYHWVPADFSTQGLAFQVFGVVVPEPSADLLGAPALLTVAALARRR
jgi:hypothetical protein